MPEDIRSRKGTPGSANPNECYTCLGPVDHWHHVVPYSMGGDITLPLCTNCHAKVHNRKSISSGALIKKAKDKQQAKGIRPRAHGPLYSPTIADRIEELTKNNHSSRIIAKKFIDDGTWAMPENYTGQWWAQSKKHNRKRWHSPELRWLTLCHNRVLTALKTINLEKQLAENKFWYELSLKPEGERSAWMPDYEPVTRGSNLPSLFTETLQPAFDLKTTATPGTWNLSQWAWDAKQDT